MGYGAVWPIVSACPGYHGALCNHPKSAYMIKLHHLGTMNRCVDYYAGVPKVHCKLVKAEKLRVIHTSTANVFQ